MVKMASGQIAIGRNGQTDMVRKEAREARMDPPIHAAYCCSPAAVIRILHPLPC